MGDKVKLKCKINCPDDMSEIFDKVAEFVVDRICDEMERYSLEEETRKELLGELVEGVMEGSVVM